MRHSIISMVATAALVAAASVHAAPAAMADKAAAQQFWWPEKLDLRPLRQHGEASNPMGEEFNYAEEFKKLDLNAVKKRY